MNNAKPHSKSIKLRLVDSNSEINPLNLITMCFQFKTALHPIQIQEGSLYFA